MPTEDDIDETLTVALIPVVAALGCHAIEREAFYRPGGRRLGLRGDDLSLDFYFAARLHEICPSLTFLTPAGPRRPILEYVQQWLGEPVQAYMFNEANLDAACRRVADFAARLVQCYRRDPTAAIAGIEAIEREATELWRIERVRTQAEAAWNRRDFGEAASLYTDISGDLTAAEGKRLDLARKKRS